MSAIFPSTIPGIFTFYKTKVYAKKECAKRKTFHSDDEALEFAVENGYKAFEVESNRKSKSKSGGLVYYFYSGMPIQDDRVGCYNLGTYNYDTMLVMDYPYKPTDDELFAACFPEEFDEEGEEGVDWVWEDDTIVTIPDDHLYVEV